MDPLTMLFLLFVGCLLFGVAKHLQLRSEVKHLRHELASITSSANTSPPPPAAHDDTVVPIALPRAGQALASPPTSLQRTLAVLRGDYAIPLGWAVVHGKAELLATHLKGDVNHILLTGQSDSGKDNVARNILLSLAATHSPQHVQFCIVDGKGLDWLAWQHKAHCWHLATDPEHVSDAMQQLTAERKRRREILAAAGVSKWDNYKGTDVPLLVVFVSELLLLQNAVGKANLTSWLNAELTAARAFGIRYIIATQTASNFDTQWRSQISLFMAGYQPLDSQDKPNVGMSASDVATLGAIAPSALPAPSSGAAGVFVAVQGAGALNVRTSFITDDHADYWLRQLPNKPAKHQPAAARRDDNLLHEMLGASLLIPDDYVLEDVAGENEARSVVVAHQNATESQLSSDVAQRSSSGVSRLHDDAVARSTALPVATAVIPESEQRAIILAAQSAPSRRAICQHVYSTTGGAGYKKVAMVCDALGLLVPTGGAVVMQ